MKFQFQIGDTGPGKYRLLARGISGYTFVNSTELEYVHKSYSVFVQTDRSVYKPGSKIQFRCVVLDSRLKPTANRQLEVYVTVSISLATSTSSIHFITLELESTLAHQVTLKPFSLINSLSLVHSITWFFPINFAPFYLHHPGSIQFDFFKSNFLFLFRKWPTPFENYKRFILYCERDKKKKPCTQQQSLKSVHLFRQVS